MGHSIIAKRVEHISGKEASISAFKTQAEGFQASSVDLRSTLAPLLRHWKLIITIFLLVLTASYGLVKLVPSRYKSTIDILIFDPQQQIDDAVQKRVSPFDVDNTAMNTEIEVMKSKSLALRVVKELGLDKDEEFQPHSRLVVWLERLGLPQVASLYAGRHTASDPDQAGALRADWAAQMLLKNLQVERKQFSYILAISVTSQDPVKSQRLAATIADDYLASQREARQQALQRVASWLKGRLDDLRARVLETEAAIEKLKAKSGLVDAGGKGNVSEQQISDLSAQLSLVRAEVADKGARLEQARRLSESSGHIQEIPEVMASSVISQLRLQQSELSRREADLRSRLGDRHADLIGVRAQLAGINKAINAEADRILGKVKNDYDAAARHEQSLEASLQNLTAVRGNSGDYVELQQLRRVADADRKLYESYLSQFNEISTRQTLQNASGRIVSGATLPDAASFPLPVHVYGFAGSFGAGVGLLLAFLVEHLRTGVKTGAEVERAFGYPVVGLIPLVQPGYWRRRLAHGRLVHTIVDAPRSQFSEAVRTMRIGLRLSNLDRVPKVILITSSIPGEGKSAAAMLLAASSAISGQRTLLMDCDLRRQSISEAFGKKQRGLADILTGTAEVADVTIKDPATDTYVIPAGSTIRNPADLLTSQRMRDVIAQLRDHYDYIVMDASPLLPVVDAVALATLADKILMIVEWIRTPRVSVAEAFKVLRPEAHRVAGIVLNKVDFKRLHTYSGGHRYASIAKYYTNR